MFWGSWSSPFEIYVLHTSVRHILKVMQPPKGRCLYDILGIRQDATSRQISLAYRKQARKHHPDKQKTEGARKAAHDAFTILNNANEVLSDPEQRKEYDCIRKNQPGSSSTRSEGTSNHSTSKPSNKSSSRPYSSENWSYCNEWRRSHRSSRPHTSRTASESSRRTRPSEENFSGNSQHRQSKDGFSSSSYCSGRRGSTDNKRESSSHHQQPHNQRVFGTCQDGRPCSRCIKQGKYCYQHVHQNPKHEGNCSGSTGKRTKSKPRSNFRGSEKEHVFGINQNGIACKRCLNKGDYCYQHEKQRGTGGGQTFGGGQGQQGQKKQNRPTPGGCKTFGVNQNGEWCKRCIKQGKFCYQHVE